VPVVTFPPPPTAVRQNPATVPAVNVPPPAIRPVVTYVPAAGVNPLPLPPVVDVAVLPTAPQNAGFDGGAQQQGAMEVVVPRGWTAWWRTGEVDCSIYQRLGTTGPCPAYEEPGLAYRRPEFTVIPGSGRWLNPPRVYGQGQAARFFCTYGICAAGYLQQVQVVPGQTYALSAWVHTWCSENTSNLYQSQLDTRDDQLNCALSLGIDPTGGLDPLSPAIQWQETYAYDTYRQLTTGPVAAQGQVMTLYLRGRSLWGLRHNDFHFDQVAFAAQ
jgi:hypothetical protein